MRVPTVYFREKVNALTLRLENIEAAGGAATPQDMAHMASLADAIEAEALLQERQLRAQIRREEQLT